MTEGEKRAWLALLREGRASSASLKELASILQREWFSDGGRPPHTSWERANGKLKTMHYQQQVEVEMKALARGGHSPRGLRSTAVAAVAKRFGIGLPGFRKQISGPAVKLSDIFGSRK
jgi:hypothetical protein